MMTFLFVIPIIFAIILLIFFNKKTVWWEYLILVLPSAGITILIYWGMISYTTSDTEYLGEYVTSIKYYEDWDEYVHKTCTETTTDSKGNTTTRTYDCSYVNYHPEEWKQVLSNGKEHNISQKEYLRLFKKWNTQNEFVDLKRSYHTNDGDCYTKSWDGLINNSKTVTIKQSYINKIKGSKSIFGFTEISKNEALKIGLYEYPELKHQSKTSLLGHSDLNQNPVLGYELNDSDLIKWQFINGFYGHIHQFRTYILVFYNKPVSIINEQKSYWEGGNKNELIVCVGLDSINNKIQWYDAFSWSDKPTYEVNLRSYFLNKDTLDFNDFANWTIQSVPKYWKRKEFKDFDYIDIELNSNQTIWLFVIIMLFNLCMTIFIIFNNETNEN